MNAPRAAARTQPPWGRLLLRGVRKQCPNCGGHPVYDTWFRMKDRCPDCGLRFEREPGFFVGAYLINLAVAFTLLFVLCMVYVGWKAANPDAGVLVPISVMVAVGILAPPFFYPYSRTVWSAIDIGMAPLEPAEEADAAAALAASRGDAPPEPGIDAERRP
ncbi:DUF983 domain-containing protein [Aquihabitans sp. G128]|uniref:DUF983 domain-containing protein n=1 Tax=Aquihabitans sp. G128 TaxID=2849779 RepID=UPI001C21DE58|nr:DUF983 domain-containing protein [Aquihabitans sp. G128]QXC61662.1 DUF983 domain-containing protein [Aquihabitans sp. G128]